MKTIATIIVPIAMALLIGACGNEQNNNNTPAPQPKDSIVSITKDNTPEAAPETPVTLNWKEIRNEHTDKLVTVEGYLRLPSFMYIGGNKLEIDLFERPNQKGGYRLICNIPTGSIDNTSSALGKQYTAADFKINTYNGETIRGEGAYVRITGRLDAYSKSHGTLREITKIEKGERKAISYQGMDVPEFSADKALAQDGKLVYVVGKLDPGIYLSTYNNAYSFTVNGPEMEKGESLVAFVNIGRGGSQVEDVKENYANKDIVIRDGTGEPFSVNDKVKVYGTFVKTNGKNGGILFVEFIVVQ